MTQQAWMQAGAGLLQQSGQWRQQMFAGRQAEADRQYQTERDESYRKWQEDQLKAKLDYDEEMQQRQLESDAAAYRATAGIMGPNIAGALEGMSSEEVVGIGSLLGPSMIENWQTRSSGGASLLAL